MYLKQPYYLVFANAYLLYKDGGISEEECEAAGFKGEDLLAEAKHGYEFLREHCIDKEYGGIFWSLNYDGTPLDTTKHTYNQAFCIYALSSYYDAAGDKEALELAFPCLISLRSAAPMRSAT